MASLAQGIVGGNMAWPLVVAASDGLADLIEVRSPMLFSVGMYLPLEDDLRHLRRAASFRWLTDRYRDKGRFQRRAEGAHRKKTPAC